MTDDIVTRLRQEWEYGNNAKGCDYEMFAHAADEIERLRAELKDADDDFHALKAMFDKMRAEVRGD